MALRSQPEVKKDIATIARLAKEKDTEELKNFICQIITVYPFESKSKGAQLVKYLAANNEVDALAFFINTFVAAHDGLFRCVDGAFTSVTRSAAGERLRIQDALLEADLLPPRYSLLEKLIMLGTRLNYRHLAESLKVRTSFYAIYFLASLSRHEIRDRVAWEFDYSDCDVDMRKFVPQANDVVSLCKERKMSLEQGCAWQLPEVQGVLALCRVQQYLPRNLFFVVATYLSPFAIDEKAAEDVLKKMSFEVRRAELSMDLHCHHASVGRLSLFRDKKFESACREAKSEANLDELIEDEMRSLTATNKAHSPYFSLLERHSTRDFLSACNNAASAARQAAAEAREVVAHLRRKQKA